MELRFIGNAEKIKYRKYEDRMHLRSGLSRRNNITQIETLIFFGSQDFATRQILPREMILYVHIDLVNPVIVDDDRVLHMVQYNTMKHKTKYAYLCMLDTKLRQYFLIGRMELDLLLNATNLYPFYFNRRGTNHDEHIGYILYDVMIHEGSNLCLDAKGIELYGNKSPEDYRGKHIMIIADAICKN